MVDTEPIDKEYLQSLEKFGVPHYARYSTLGSRCLANCIDGVVIGILTAPILFSIPEEWWLNELELIATVTWALKFIPYFYSIVLHGKYGRTLGKRFMGLKVIDLSERREIGYKQAFLRELIPLIGLACLFVAVASVHMFNEKDPADLLHFIIEGVAIGWFALEILTAAFNEKRRALHDYIAKTVVVQL
jgi:uncharacterized RDD family membrane protein YckC